MLKTMIGDRGVPAPAWTSISSAGTARRPRSRPSSQCFAEAVRPRPAAPSSPGTNRPARPACRSSTAYDADGPDAGPDPQPVHRADPRPAGQAAAADPGRDRPAGRRRRPQSFRLRDAASRGRAGWCSTSSSARCGSKDVARTPVVSALRGFSAPVKLTTDAPAKDRYVLLAADPDLFNRWEAGQDLARDLILARAAGAPDEVGEERFAEARRPRPERPVVGTGVQGPAAGAAQRIRPGACGHDPADPAAIHEAREALRARHGRPSGRAAARPARRPAGRRRVLARRRQRRPPRAAQRRPRAAGRRPARR